jgi:hypothetical protein
MCIISPIGIVEVDVYEFEFPTTGFTINPIIGFGGK